MRRSLAAFALTGLTACGTTVPAAQQLGASAADQGIGAPAQSGAMASVGVDTKASEAQDALLGRLPGPSSAPNASTTTSAPSSGSQAPVVRNAGGSTEPLRVGVLYLTGADKAASALGVDGLSTGDTQAQAKAVLQWVSAHGGFGGRKPEVSYYGVPAGGSNPEADQQAGCTSLVQDHHVEYVVSILNLFDATMACFDRAHVGVVDDASGLTSRQMTRYASSFAGPGDFSADRLMKVLVDDLWSRAWLSAGSKVGVYTYDTPDDTALARGPVTAYLKSHGLTPIVLSGSNGGSGVSDAGAAVLKFSASGVDRIIPVLASPLFLMTAASSQDYHPAFAMYSYFGPAFLEGAAPADELVGAAGIGYQPHLDIGAGTKPGPVSSNEALCQSIMRAAGQQSTSGTTTAVEMQVCTAILYLKALADTRTTNTLLTARTVVGTGFAPADTFRSDVRTRVDGAAGVRDLAYEQDCKCFQYVSEVRPTA